MYCEKCLEIYISNSQYEYYKCIFRLINERNLKIFEDQDPMPPNYVKVKTRSLTEFIGNIL